MTAECVSLLALILIRRPMCSGKASSQSRQADIASAPI
jgi:hypothetical protein